MPLQTYFEISSFSLCLSVPGHCTPSRHPATCSPQLINAFCREWRRDDRAEQAPMAVIVSARPSGAPYLSFFALGGSGSNERK